MPKPILRALLILLFCAAGRIAPAAGPVPPPAPPAPEAAGNFFVTPLPIPGAPRDRNDRPTEGYGPSAVQTHLRMELTGDTKEVHFVRDNNDPYVITKAYELKNADPYALRGYLLTVVNSKRIAASPAEVTALKFNDGRGVLLVSAEDYRFRDSGDGYGIDKIIEELDKPDMPLFTRGPAYVYFPKYNRAANLAAMLRNVGLNDYGREFVGEPNTLMIDAPLNLLVATGPVWARKHFERMLAEYDRPLPEVRIAYRIMEIYTEHDDRIGIDFQNWKNNDGVDLFSAGGRYRRNWNTFFLGDAYGSGNSKTEFWNFNPKWNSRYLDFLASRGQARLVTSGVLIARNRTLSRIRVDSGMFYDWTDSSRDPVDVNPDQNPRDTVNSILPNGEKGLDALLNVNYYPRYIIEALYPNATKAELDAIYNQIESGYPGRIHGKDQTPMPQEGFIFNLSIAPVVTRKSSQILVDMEGLSLIGWNSNGTPRTSRTTMNTAIQIGHEGKEFIVGGIRKVEVVRSIAGLPWVKDIPFLGWLVSDESESTKVSQLVLIATAEYVRPETVPNATIMNDVGKIVRDVNKGVKSPINNVGFQQYWFDTDKIE